KKAGYAPRLFYARGASDAKALISIVGQDAEFALGAKEYDARTATPENQRFVSAYRAKWKSVPDSAAAEGYAAGSILAEGLRRAGSAEPLKLRTALGSLEATTVLGPFKVDPATGEQVAAVPLLEQVIRARAQIVWPEALETAKLVPYPQW